MSQDDMNTALEKKSPWWSEPMVWLIIVLPVSAVVASGITVWLAAHNADTLVAQEVVKQGLAVNLATERDRKAAELAVAATLSAEPGRMKLHLEGRFDTLPKSLVLTLAHPSDPAKDMVLLFQPSGAGEYSVDYATIPAGKRLLELAPVDKAWRLAGHWQAPFTGSMRLAASDSHSATPQSSTQP
jgi:uncharacterized protein